MQKKIPESLPRSCVSVVDGPIRHILAAAHQDGFLEFGLIEEFQDGDEGPVFSNDYLTAWIEKKDNRTYEISISEASKVFDGDEFHVDTYEINLPNNYFGCFPF